MHTSKRIIEKQVDEIINISMNFASWLQDGVIINDYSISISPDDSSITLSNDAISDSEIVMTVEGGNPGIKYNFEITIETSDSQTLIGNGILHVHAI